MSTNITNLEENRTTNLDRYLDNRRPHPSQLANISTLIGHPAIEHRQLPITSIATYTPCPGIQSADDLIFTGTSTLWFTVQAPTTFTSTAVRSAPSIAKFIPVLFLLFPWKLLQAYIVSMLWMIGKEIMSMSSKYATHIRYACEELKLVHSCTKEEK